MGILVFGFDDECVADFIPKLSQLYKEKIFWITASTKIYYKSENIKIIKRFDLPLAQKINKSQEDKVRFNGILDKEEYFYLLNRLKKSLGNFSDKLKERILEYQLNYWNDFIEQNEISLFVGSNLPHENEDYIIYKICKHKRIKTLLFYQVFTSCVILVKEIEELNNYCLINKNVDISVKEKLRPYIISFIKERGSEFTSLFYMDKDKIRAHKKEKFLIKIKRRIKKRRSFSKLFSVINFLFLKNYFTKRFVNEQLNIYKKIVKDVDLSKKYIYYPLHYQPEMTTCPMAINGYYEQLKIIKEVASVLPLGYYLYVKENPKQSWICRSKKYYEREEENVVFVSLDIASEELIKNSIGVITVTGTAGWEAIVRNKFVLTFGNCIYNSINTVGNILDRESLEELILDMINRNLNSNKISKEEYFRNLNDTSIKANIAQYYYNNSDLDSYDDNVENLINILRNKVK